MEGLIMLALLLVILTIIENYHKPKLKSYTPSVSYEFSEAYKLQEFRSLKKEYLNSYIWEAKRQEALQLANYMCSSCKTASNLEVHHDTGYRIIPYEPVSNLRVLCRTCHTALHNKYGYPQTLEEYYNFNTTNLH